jgi:Domain of unknown function DUF29
MTRTSYECDFHEWALDQARRVRAGEPIDRENVAEELETLGRSLQRELKSCVVQIIEHLLKLRLTTDSHRGANERGWRVSIVKQQQELADLLEESPSLRGMLTPEFLSECYKRGAKNFAMNDFGTATKVALPRESMFGWKEILGEE